MGIYQGLNKISGAGAIYANSPIGSVIQYMGDKLPNGYLRCDGIEISKSDYSDLYDVIGDKFGTTTNDNTFKLPTIESTTGTSLIKARNYNTTGAETVVVDDSLYAKKIDVAATVNDLKNVMGYNNPRYVKQYAVPTKGWHRFGYFSNVKGNDDFAGVYDIKITHPYTVGGTESLFTRLLISYNSKSQFKNISWVGSNERTFISKLRLVGNKTDNYLALDFYYDYEESKYNIFRVSIDSHADVKFNVLDCTLVEETVENENILAAANVTVTGWDLIGSTTSYDTTIGARYEWYDEFLVKMSITGSDKVVDTSYAIIPKALLSSTNEDFYLTGGYGDSSSSLLACVRGVINYISDTFHAATFKISEVYKNGTLYNQKSPTLTVYARRY